ncbi:MAG: ComEC family competence protein [Bacteroidetes bacterium]|nr:ComEC family competence protein [Bacteroidota bacterium]
MNIWSQIPFLRLLLPFIAGILTAVYSEWQFDFLNYVIPSLFLVIALFVFIKRLNVSYAYSWVFGAFIAITLFLSGFQITFLNTDKFKTNHFSRFLDDTELFYVKTNGTSLEKEKSYKIVVQVLAVKQKNKWIETSGSAMCYFKKDSLSKQLRYGDCMIVKTKFNEVKPPQNPGEFNYKRFLSFHNIYHSAYIPSENWKSLGINSGNKILSASYNLREYLLNIYRENNISGDEYAVGSALVLGYTDKLDQDIIQAYASSGALHVLSVSGLHVGIIYIIFNYLLFFLDRFKHGKLIKCISLLFILWFYATLTGLSPSVLRSAAMFTFIIVAKTWKYNTNIFNTLCVSCFALLVYNPYLIMEVGFQLSYLAVLGIVSIQPWLYEKWQPNNWLMNQIWGIISVSIAAQMATFPLGLLYFHQFPNYFLFSNLIVIPVSTLILGYGILMFALGKISAIGIVCGKIFTWLVWFLNESALVTEQMPGALIQGISIKISETWMIYLVIICFMIYLFQQRVRFIFPALGILLLILSLQVYENYRERKQNILIVYSIPKISAYDFISGKKTIFVANLALLNNPSSMIFHIKHNWADMGINSLSFIEKEKKRNYKDEDFIMKNNFIEFDNKKIILADSLPKTKSPLSNKLEVDLIILSKNSKIRIADLKKCYNFRKIIIDSSNQEWRNEKWKKECEDLKIDFYSVIDSGAYVEELL